MNVKIGKNIKFYNLYNMYSFISTIGFNAETTTERLKLYFENARRSRGGPIEDIDFISGNRAVVAFVNKQGITISSYLNYLQPLTWKAICDHIYHMLVT